MHWVTALCLLVFGVLPNKTSHAVTLSPCVDNVTELVRSRVNNTVTCGGILGSDFVVEWSLTILGDPNVYSVGLCVSVGTCNSSLELGYTATRPSADTSLMTIDPSVNVTMVRNGTLTCNATRDGKFSQSAYCLLDIISPAQNTSCSVQAVTSGSSWTITGRCNVTRVYSSLDRYRCRWYSKVGFSESAVGQPVAMQTTPTNDVLSGGTYVNGVCNVTMPLLSEGAVLLYRVVVFPGAREESAGSLEIRKPSTNHTCPQYVPEGQNLTCSCAGDIGTPPGAFSWVNGSRSAVLTVTNVRRAQQSYQYRCQAVWNGTAVLPYANYTLDVAYGPDYINGSVTNPFDTNGSLNLTLVCNAFGVNPNVTWMWTRPPNSNVIYHGQSYTFNPQPPYDDGSVFQCLAQNTISNLTLTYNFAVNLNYPPTTDPVITNNSSSRDGQLYHDDIVTFTCTVTGGKPVNSTTVTLACPEKQSTTGYVGSTGVTSSVTFDPVLNSDHNTQCTCNTKWKQTDWYTRSVQTTLFVNSPPLTTELTLNARNNITVSENETVVIECKTDGRPTPYIQLAKTDTGVIVEGAGSRLNKILSAQCQDTGVYNCTATNGVGERLTDPAMLFVNCKPRYALTGGPQTVDYAGQPTHLNFSLVAFPRPDYFTFAYLGPDGLTSAGQNARDVTLTMACFSQQPIFNVNCLLTVEDVKTNASFGYYIVRVANSLGSLDLNFRLTGELLPGAAATAEGLNAGGAAAVAVVVTLVVVVVVIGVVMVWLWRRSWVLPCAGTNCGSRANPRTNNASDNGNGGRQDLNLHKTITTNKGAPTLAESSSDESHYAGLRTRQFDLSLAYTKLGAPGRVTEDDSANPVYQNVKADNKVYENVQTGQVHQSDKTGPVYQNVSAKKTRTYANFNPKTQKRH